MSNVQIDSRKHKSAFFKKSCLICNFIVLNVLLYTNHISHLPPVGGNPGRNTASRMQASEAPGLGVEPLADVIGQAVAVYK